MGVKLSRTRTNVDCKRFCFKFFTKIYVKEENYQMRWKEMTTTWIYFKASREKFLD
ncbi:hypothetical protein IC582_026449 [Cucumis melo]